MNGQRLRSTVDSTTLTWSVEMNSLKMPHTMGNIGSASSETAGAGQMGVISHLETGNQVPVKENHVQCYFRVESGSLKIVMTTTHSSAMKVSGLLDCFQCS